MQLEKLKLQDKNANVSKYLLCTHAHAIKKRKVECGTGSAAKNKQTKPHAEEFKLLAI